MLSARPDDQLVIVKVVDSQWELLPTFGFELVKVSSHETVDVPVAVTLNVVLDVTWAVPDASLERVNV